MKKIAYLLAITLFITTPYFGKAQEESPVAYLSNIGKIMEEMNKQYMAYMSAAAHGRRARKIEKVRQQVVTTIINSRYKAIEQPYYKGDNALRQSAIDYITVCHNVFNEDYAKIVNMEEIAEQSFDQMQAFILLQEKTSEKLKEAGSKMERAQRAFTTKYNINIIESTSELSDKMEVAGKLTHYINQVYLLFFKCYWQDGEMHKALQSKKVNDAEQARNSLIKYAKEGMIVLDTMKVFNGDALLANACKNALREYQKMAETEITKITDFYLKEDNFKKLQKNMETKGGNRTKEDVDAYNNAVKEINAAINGFNQINTDLLNRRNTIIKDWDETEKKFKDTHMPFYKK